MAYDATGSLTSNNGALHEYDPFHLMWHFQSGAEDWRYVYTADDERIWSFKTGGSSRWTLRDLGNNVLREYANTSLGWSVTEDFIHRGGQLLAADTSTGVSHFHLDHLGTPRLVTDQTGKKIAYHVYWPYGEELTAPNQDAERMKFTGHERDLNGLAGTGDDLDYMHARFCSPVTGRFLGVDAAKGDPDTPQTWNRYVYALGNPIRLLDPDGRAVQSFNLVTSGPNKVPIASVPPTLGLEQNNNGFHLNTNVRIDFDEGDNLNSYTVERDAFTVTPSTSFRTGKDEDPDDPGQVSREGPSMFVYDGPGLEASIDGRPASSAMIGSGDYVSVYEMRVVNSETGKYDQQRFYYAISVQYDKGKAVGFDVKTLSEAEYRTYSKQRRKERPNK